MGKFINVDTMVHLVDQVGIEQFLHRLVCYLEEDYCRWQDFDKSARLAAHHPQGVIELMPIADQQNYAFKYVNGHPNNTHQQLMTVMAFGVLADMATGYPILMSELTLSTALRTAATSVMAAKKLARKDASVMALLGNGSQSEFQAIAFHLLLGIKEVRCFDIDRNASEKLKNNLKAYPELTVTLCTSAKQATQGADIITTVTADKRYATILTPDMVHDGVHINGVGGDCPGKTEIAAEILHKAEIFVEYEPQTRIEGDIQQLKAEHPVTEIWQVLTQKAHGRQNDTAITFFDSVGFALEDFSTLRLINDISEELHLGEPLTLIPDLTNPKDLFSLLNHQPMSDKQERQNERRIA